MTTTDPRTAKQHSPAIYAALSGSDSLNGHDAYAAQEVLAVEGQDSPQARGRTTPRSYSPAGSTTAPSVTVIASPKDDTPEGRKTSQDHGEPATQKVPVLADDIPGRQMCREAHDPPAAGEQDPLLALAADVLDDLERVRIANENRLRQLTRDQADADGQERGFGLDESHPDVARLAALVGMLADAEHKATLNLQRQMRAHPLGPWVKATVGIGEKQGARLIASIGDPYWNDLHQRPRTVSELWAYCGYHVVPADHGSTDGQRCFVGGALNGSGPGQAGLDSQGIPAGVAPKRQRGQRANWSADAKMRAYLAAESCMKQRGSPYRDVYDATRAKYAEAAHASECVRCGPKGKPAQPGSPLSEGHKHARALRAVAKEILRDLWREARSISDPEAS